MRHVPTSLLHSDLWASASAYARDSLVPRFVQNPQQLSYNDDGNNMYATVLWLDLACQWLILSLYSFHRPRSTYRVSIDAPTF